MVEMPEIGLIISTVRILSSFFMAQSSDAPCGCPVYPVTPTRGVATEIHSHMGMFRSKQICYNILRYTGVKWHALASHLSLCIHAKFDTKGDVHSTALLVPTGVRPGMAPLMLKRNKYDVTGIAPLTGGKESYLEWIYRFLE